MKAKKDKAMEQFSKNLVEIMEKYYWQELSENVKKALSKKKSYQLDM